MFEDDEQIPSKTYKVVHNRIVGFTDDLDAVEQAVDKILQTERFQYEIYSESYGHDLIDLIGQDFDLAFSEIERLIIEALTADDRVDGIENLTLNKTSKNTLVVTFTVSTIFGSINKELEVEV
ncbi:DUF2634 domain-containing protein [Aerococcus urinaeequi]|uniref:DUF2634 domain-containing protein n=1 Tax=Aerococcus urinaeequi TaxID=51665 RepID=UPI003EC90559